MKCSNLSRGVSAKVRCQIPYGDRLEYLIVIFRREYKTCEFQTVIAIIIRAFDMV
jgi:hypothetical protein